MTIRIFLGTFFARSLLRHLAPSTRFVVVCAVRTGALGRHAGVNHAFIGESLAPNEFFGEMTRIDRARNSMHGFGDDFRLGWEEH